VLGVQTRRRAFCRRRPGGGQHFHHPLVAVLVALAPGVGVGAVVGTQQSQRLPLVGDGAVQAGAGAAAEASMRAIVAESADAIEQAVSS